jgi:hypothetical protein
MHSSEAVAWEAASEPESHSKVEQKAASEPKCHSTYNVKV